MASYFDSAWYVDYGDGATTGYYSVAVWVINHAYAAGNVVRQAAAPTVGNERVFVCIVAGTSHLTTEPTWVVTRGAKTTDNTVTWMEMTGVAGLNGDTTNTPDWTAAKAGNASPSLGCLIKRTSGTSYWVCTTAGTMGASEPAWSSDTAGTTQADNTVTWTSLGLVGAWTAWKTPQARLANLVTSAGWITKAASTPNNISGQCDVYVASEHAETQSSAMTFSDVFGRASTSNIMARVLCVTKTTVPPTSANLTTGATITTTGASAINGLIGWFYMQGISFSAGSGAVSSLMTITGNGCIAYFKNCAFTKAGTTAASNAITIPNNNAQAIFDNCTMQFGNTGDGLNIQLARVLWKNTVSAIAGATIPTNFLGVLTNAEMVIEGVDLSAITGTLVNVNSGSQGRAILRNCKVAAGVTVANIAVTSSANAPTVDLIRCDSGATNYRHERYWWAGSHVVETTIVRTGGATDGTTPISWKIVTTSPITWGTPFETMPMMIWNDSTAANVTVTVFGIWGGGAVPNNNDIWLEIEYPGSSATPIGTINTATTIADILAAGSAVASDTSTWGGSTTAFKLTTTLSSPQPQAKGPILVTVKVGDPSQTYYIDPQPVLS